MVSLLLLYFNHGVRTDTGTGSTSNALLHVYYHGGAKPAAVNPVRHDDNLNRTDCGAELTPFAPFLDEIDFGQCMNLLS